MQGAGAWHRRQGCWTGEGHSFIELVIRINKSPAAVVSPLGAVDRQRGVIGRRRAAAGDSRQTSCNCATSWCLLQDKAFTCQTLDAAGSILVQKNPTLCTISPVCRAELHCYKDDFPACCCKGVLRRNPLTWTSTAVKRAALWKDEGEPWHSFKKICIHVLESPSTSRAAVSGQFAE